MSVQVPKDPIIKVQHYVNKKIIVNFIGGRQIIGILKSFDINLNMILDEAIETIQGANYYDHDGSNEAKQRKIGLIIIRGAMMSQVMSAENYEIIENPFQQEEQE